MEKKDIKYAITRIFGWNVWIVNSFIQSMYVIIPMKITHPNCVSNNGMKSQNQMDYHKILIETLELHDIIDRIASSTHWSGCSCDHGCDGRVYPRIGPMCPRCVADERIREIKKLIDFDKPKRETKAKADSLDSASL